MTPATWTQSPLERRTAHRPSCAPTISTTVTAAILKKAAAEAPHYVLFVSLSGHGAAEKAHYRVAAITGMVNACTTVPPKLPPIPVAVAC